MRVVAIDPGTSCGYAWTDDYLVRSAQGGVWELRPNRHEGGGMRYLRFGRYFDELLEAPPGPCVVVYEEVRRHMGTDAAHVYGGILAVLQAKCEERGVAYMSVPVGTIKKRATGKGNAAKDAIVEAASAAFGEPIIDDNHADALWLLQVAIDQIVPRERNDRG